MSSDEYKKHRDIVINKLILNIGVNSTNDSLSQTMQVLNSFTHDNKETTRTNFTIRSLSIQKKEKNETNSNSEEDIQDAKKNEAMRGNESKIISNNKGSDQSRKKSNSGNSERLCQSDLFSQSSKIENEQFNLFLENKKQNNNIDYDSRLEFKSCLLGNDELNNTMKNESKDTNKKWNNSNNCNNININDNYINSNYKSDNISKESRYHAGLTFKNVQIIREQDLFSIIKEGKKDEILDNIKNEAEFQLNNSNGHKNNNKNNIDNIEGSFEISTKPCDYILKNKLSNYSNLKNNIIPSEAVDANSNSNKNDDNNQENDVMNKIYNENNNDLSLKENDSNSKIITSNNNNSINISNNNNISNRIPSSYKNVFQIPYENISKQQSYSTGGVKSISTPKSETFRIEISKSEIDLSDNKSLDLNLNKIISTNTNNSVIKPNEIEEPTPIKINDIVEVINKKDNSIKQALVLRIKENDIEENIESYKDLLHINSLKNNQITKETYLLKRESISSYSNLVINSNDNNEAYSNNHNQQQSPFIAASDYNKKFYVHFINFEKRMDNWISPYSIIRKVMNQESSNFNNNISMKQNKGSSSKTDYITNFCNKGSFSKLSSKNITNSMLTRKRSNLNVNDEFLLDGHFEFNSNIKNIESIIFGMYEIETWYYSPYPSQVTTRDKKLYICEYCLKYMTLKETLVKHIKLCNKKYPGKEIYKMPLNNTNSSNITSIANISNNSQLSNNFSNLITPSLSVYEVKGSEHKLFCQNLSLLSKLFLDHKSIYFDVSPFNFYVLIENDHTGPHFVGYFSKELSPLSEFNLACIMVLPPYQKTGYGQFLISLSYYFSRLNNKIGSPEVPLSDLGRLSYKSYWTIVLLEVLVKSKCNVTLKDLSEITYIKFEDVIYTLSELNLIKYWRGQQVLQSVNQRQLEEFLKKKKISKAHHVKFNPEYFIK